MSGLIRRGLFPTLSNAPVVSQDNSAEDHSPTRNVAGTAKPPVPEKISPPKIGPVGDGEWKRTGISQVLAHTHHTRDYIHTQPSKRLVNVPLGERRPVRLGRKSERMVRDEREAEREISMELDDPENPLDRMQHDDNAFSVGIQADIESDLAAVNNPRNTAAAASSPLTRRITFKQGPGAATAAATGSPQISAAVPAADFSSKSGLSTTGAGDPSFKHLYNTVLTQRTKDMSRDISNRYNSKGKLDLTEIQKKAEAEGWSFKTDYLSKYLTGNFGKLAEHLETEAEKSRRVAEAALALHQNEDPGKLMLAQLINDAVDAPLPPSEIPEEFREVDRAQIRQLLDEFSNAKISYNEELKLWENTLFPSSQPTSRMEVLYLARCLDAMLAKRQRELDGPDGPVPEALEVPYHENATISDFLEFDFKRAIGDEIAIWDVILAEIVRQCHVQCTERGLLLNRIRKKYQESFSLISPLYTNMQRMMYGMQAQIDFTKDEVHRLEKRIEDLPFEIHEDYRERIEQLEATIEEQKEITKKEKREKMAAQDELWLIEKQYQSLREMLKQRDEALLDQFDLMDEQIETKRQLTNLAGRDYDDYPSTDGATPRRRRLVAIADHDTPDPDGYESAPLSARASGPRSGTQDPNTAAALETVDLSGYTNAMSQMMERLHKIEKGIPEPTTNNTNINAWIRGNKQEDPDAALEAAAQAELNTMLHRQPVDSDGDDKNSDQDGEAPKFAPEIDPEEAAKKAEAEKLLANMPKKKDPMEIGELAIQSLEAASLDLIDFSSWMSKLEDHIVQLEEEHGIMRKVPEEEENQLNLEETAETMVILISKYIERVRQAIGVEIEIREKPGKTRLSTKRVKKPLEKKESSPTIIMGENGEFVHAAPGPREPSPTGPTPAQIWESMFRLTDAALEEKGIVQQGGVVPMIGKLPDPENDANFENLFVSSQDPALLLNPFGGDSGGSASIDPDAFDAKPVKIKKRIATIADLRVKLDQKLLGLRRKNMQTKENREVERKKKEELRRQLEGEDDRIRSVGVQVGVNIHFTIAVQVDLGGGSLKAQVKAAESNRAAASVQGLNFSELNRTLAKLERKRMRERNIRDRLFSMLSLEDVEMFGESHGPVIPDEISLGEINEDLAALGLHVDAEVALPKAPKIDIPAPADGTEDWTERLKRLTQNIEGPEGPSATTDDLEMIKMLTEQGHLPKGAADAIARKMAAAGLKALRTAADDDPSAQPGEDEEGGEKGDKHAGPVTTAKGKIQKVIGISKTVTRFNNQGVADSGKPRRAFKARHERLLDAAERVKEGSIKAKSRLWLMRLIRDVYKDKVNSDQVQDRLNLPHLSMPDFLFDYLKQLYGTKSLVDLNASAVVATVTALRDDDAHVETFAKFLEEDYTVDMLDMYLKAISYIEDLKIGLNYLVPVNDLTRQRFVDLERCIAVTNMVLGERHQKAQDNFNNWLGEKSVKADDSDVKQLLLGQQTNKMIKSQTQQLEHNYRKVDRGQFLFHLCEFWLVYEAAFANYIEEVFRATDTNVDGFITEDEFKRMMQKELPLAMSGDIDDLWVRGVAGSLNPEAGRLDFKGFNTVMPKSLIVKAQFKLNFIPNMENFGKDTTLEGQQAMVLSLSRHWQAFSPVYQQIMSMFKMYTLGNLHKDLFKIGNQVTKYLKSDIDPFRALEQYRKILTTAGSGLLDLQGTFKILYGGPVVDSTDLKRLDEELGSLEKNVMGVYDYVSKRVSISAAPVARQLVKGATMSKIISSLQDGNTMNYSKHKEESSSSSSEEEDADDDANNGSKIMTPRGGAQEPHPPSGSKPSYATHLSASRKLKKAKKKVKAKVKKVEGIVSTVGSLRGVRASDVNASGTDLSSAGEGATTTEAEED